MDQYEFYDFTFEGLLVWRTSRQATLICCGKRLPAMAVGVALIPKWLTYKLEELVLSEST